MRRHTSNEKRLEKAKAAWGAELASVADVSAVFVNYAAGDAFFHYRLGCGKPLFHHRLAGK